MSTADFPKPGFWDSLTHSNKQAVRLTREAAELLSEYVALIDEATELLRCGGDSR
jgi:hypothetical protein